MSTDIEARVMIHDLYAKYCFALDKSDPEAFVDCFSVEGVFDVVGRAEFRGHAAMRSLIEATSERRPRHHFLNFHLKRVSDGTAEGIAYFILLDPKTAETNAYGHYEDALVLEEDGFWRFVDRKVYFEWRSDSYDARKVPEVDD